MNFVSLRTLLQANQKLRSKASVVGHKIVDEHSFCWELFSSPPVDCRWLISSRLIPLQGLVLKELYFHEGYIQW
ncbi:hypothetical protein ACROYT_G013865 [Oculina patagonica]